MRSRQSAAIRSARTLQSGPERHSEAGVALQTKGDGTMTTLRHRRRLDAADLTGWLLGATIVVLVVLDLMIWGTLWNVPNPISIFLEPQAVSATTPLPHAAPAPFR